LAENGKSVFSIVIPKAANEKEKRAASIVSHYFEVVTKVTLPVVTEDNFRGAAGIYVGATRKFGHNGPDGIEGEGLLLGTTDRDVYLCGGSGQGIIYAAYTFVDQVLGCKKYDQGAPFCPDRALVTIGDHIRQLENPDFLYRESYYPASEDAEYLQWHKLHRFEDLWGMWGHSFFKIIPPENFFTSHPEYFSEINGKRQPQQLCLSNDDVLGLTIAYLEKAIAKNPDAMYWSVAQNDGGGYCTCEKCRRVDLAGGGPQASILTFVNKLAAKFPNITFTTLAYGYSRQPPVNVVPAKNVVIMLSTIDAERAVPLALSASAANFRNDLQQWGKITDHLFVWDYTTQFTNYLAPFPDYENLQSNAAYFKAHKVSGVFFQGSGSAYSDMAELNSYLQAEVLWNSSVSAKDVEQVFEAGYYGAAAPFLEAYLSDMQRNVKTMRVTLDIYGNPVNNYQNFLSPQLIEKYSVLFDRAGEAVKGNKLILQRVKRARLGLTYAGLQQAKRFPNGLNGYLTNDVVKPGWALKVNDFVADARAAGVKTLTEDGDDLDGYAAKWGVLLGKRDLASMAKGANVTLKYPFADDYPANGKSTLTDGIFGTTDFSFNWLFLYGNDLDATIDLKAVKQFDRISMNFLIDPKHHIYPPSAVTLYASADGTTYRLLASRPSFAEPAQTGVLIDHVLFSIKGGARFIRVVAKCRKMLPGWDLSPNKKPALCCDEIVVN
jgi:hypothetical protein